MRPPIIGFDAQSLTGKNPTGLGVYSLRLVKVLQRHPEALDLRLIWPTRRKPFRRTMERLIWEQYYLVFAAIKEEVDLIHVPCFSVPRMTKIPKVVTAHDLVVLRYPKLMAPGSRWYFSRWIPSSYRSADHIIAVSHATKNDLVQLLGIDPDKIAVIHHGLNPGFKRTTDPHEINRIRYKYRVPTEFLLMVGSFEPRKNIHHAIDAFSRISDATDRLKLVLVGKSNAYQTKMQEKAKSLGVEDQVLFPGYVRDSELVTLYSLAAAFLFPSAAEGFGLPLLEAMATGCPMIVSDIPVFHEIAGDTAVYVPAGDPAALAQRMQRMVEDRSYRASFFRKVLGRSLKYDWDRAAKETLKVYMRVLNRRGVDLSEK